MVLGSQSPREGHSRLYMVSRKRKPSVLRWLVLLVLVAGAGYGVWWLLFSGPKPSPSGHSGQGATSVVTSFHGPSTATKPREQAPTPATPSAKNNQTAQNDSGTQSTGGQPAVKFSLSGTPPKQVAPVTPTQAPAPVATGSGQTAPTSPQSVADNTVSSAAAYSGDPGSDIAKGMEMIAARHWIQGRKLLSHVLFDDSSLSDADAATIRDTLSSINQELIFSSKVDPNDPLTEKYQVQRGDLLARIAPRFHVPYQFIEQINGVKGRNLRAGQTIKLVKGPFNVRVVKHLFLLDVYLTGPDGLPIYIRSFPVGLGKKNSTPVGHWIVQAGHKVVNPRYDNSRTGEHFGRNDPKNPVGNYWMGLKGVDKNTQGLSSYGIHGTIDPSSIGHEDSLGCIRLRDADIKELFNMLEAGESKVLVLP